MLKASLLGVDIHNDIFELVDYYEISRKLGKNLLRKTKGIRVVMSIFFVFMILELRLISRFL
jgi:hypothetical protein